MAQATLDQWLKGHRDDLAQLAAKAGEASKRSKKAGAAGGTRTMAAKTYPTFAQFGQAAKRMSALQKAATGARKLAEHLKPFKRFIAPAHRNAIAKELRAAASAIGGK